MTKQPSYRFAGYAESWEEKKLGNLGSVEMCKRIFKEETSAEFEIPFFKIGTFGGEADTYITREKFEEYKTKFAYPQRGDLLLSASGSIGRVVEYDGDEAYYQDSNIVWLNHHGKINNKFLKAFYEIVSWSGIEGTTIKRLYNKNILETDISLPSLPEQTAIGSFFQDIDQLISLQQRKLEVLKEHKKTYLKLLFPAKGQTKPVLRFAGFEDEWKEVKLGDFVEISKGIQRNKEFLSPNADSKNCYPVYNGGKQESGYTDEFNREGNIMISEGGASAGFVNYFDGKYWSGGHNFTIDELENDIYYVLALLESQQQELYSLQVGSGLPNIQLNSLKKVIITFPAFLEQQAIGSFFQDLDKAIAKQEEKVNQLKESKQTLLRKMFI